MNDNYQQLKAIFQTKTPPYAFLMLDEVNKNLELVKKRSGHKKIRLATKSIRSVKTLLYLMEKLGEQCSGLMCYHIDEIIWLSEKMNTHFLMGYPQALNDKQAEQLAYLVKKGIKITHMIDSVEQIQKLNEQATKHQVTFEICVDLDMSLKLPGLNFGVFRSPLNQIEKIKELYEAIKKASNLKCTSLMGYEAQVAGVGDAISKNPLMNIIIGFLKKISTAKIYELRLAATQLANEYFSLEFVNGGGSGSLTMTAKDVSVTEVTAGSAFYAPALFDSYIEGFHPAMGYAMAVQRKPTNNIITVHGGGYVASGSLDRNKLPVIHAPKTAKLHPNEMAGEVQTPITNINASEFQLLDPIFFRHSKAGELLERFKSFLVVENSQIKDEWKSYRGEEQCFL